MADPASKQLTAQIAFALVLETACEEFETLQAMLGGQIRLSGTEREDCSRKDRLMSDGQVLRATATIRMALAKSFLFNANRANRICFKNKASLVLNRKERERFLKATEPLSPVRDVNEHGYDGDKRSEKNKPSMHSHDDGGVLDETSLVVAGRDKIFMGPLNLYDVYLAVDRMRATAGFMALGDKKTKIATPAAN